MKEFDDFFDDLKQKMLEHEEPYVEGAWERFASKAGIADVKAKSTGKTISLWKWLGAAAAVALGAMLLVSVLNRQDKNNIPDTAGVEAKIQTGLPDSGVAHIDTMRNQTGVSNIVTAKPHHQEKAVSLPDFNSNKNNQLVNHHPIPTVNPVIVPPVQEQKNNNNQGLVVQPVTPKVNKPVEQPKHFYENQIVPNTPDNAGVAQQKAEKTSANPVAPNQPPAQTATAHSGTSQKLSNKKWESSLFVSPIVGDKVNVGYGYSIGYAISNRLSISSGLAYNKMSNSKSVHDQPVASAGLLSSNQSGAVSENTFSRSVIAVAPAPKLVAVKGVVSGIDVPLNVNYKINKKLYASTGVSGMVVINESPAYTYMDDKQQRITVRANSTGEIQYDNTASFSNYNTVAAPVNESAAKTAPVIGFYNLSLGFRQKISRKNAVALEPFIKIPMKKATSHSVDYLGTGVKVKFDF